jgi:hypothetical protein
MAEELTRMDITTVASGAAVELFDHAMTEVLANILDENRSPTETRKITMTFEIKPSKERNSASVSIQTKTTLSPVIKADALMFFRKERGKPKAYAHNFEEREIFDEAGNLKPIKSV